MKKIYLLSLVLIIGISRVSGQTFLERKIEYYKKQVEIQDQNILDQKMRPYHFKKLEKWGYNVSKINFEQLEDKKLVVLYFENKEKSKQLLGTGIIFNALGTTLMFLGGNIINNTRNDPEGFGTALGMLVVVLGTGVNFGTIPMYVASYNKKQKYLILKQRMENFKGF